MAPAGDRNGSGLGWRRREATRATTIPFDDLDALDGWLTGARLWGLELEHQYRVLAATLEVAADRHPDGADAADPRLQLLLHPVSRVAALLINEAEGRVTIERFTVEQLAQVVDRFDGPALPAGVIDGPAPVPEDWAPELSLDGASKAFDGRTHHLDLAVSGVHGRRLRLAAWFDVAELRRPDGSDIASLGG